MLQVMRECCFFPAGRGTDQIVYDFTSSTCARPDRIGLKHILHLANRNKNEKNEKKLKLNVFSSFYTDLNNYLVY